MLQVYARYMLLVVGDPPARVTSRDGFESSRDVVVVWGGPGRLVDLEYSWEGGAASLVGSFSDGMVLRDHRVYGGPRLVVESLATCQWWGRSVESGCGGVL